MGFKSLFKGFFRAFGHFLSAHRKDELEALEHVAEPAAEVVSGVDWNGDGKVAGVATIADVAMAEGGELASKVLRDGEINAAIFEHMPLGDFKRWLGRALMIKDLLERSEVIPDFGRLDTALQNAYEVLDDRAKRAAEHAPASN